MDLHYKVNGQFLRLFLNHLAVHVVFTLQLCASHILWHKENSCPIAISEYLHYFLWKKCYTFISTHDFNFNFNLFSVYLVHMGYDPSDMELVNTEIRLQISYMK